jgi:magnesium chelatase family protein
VDRYQRRLSGPLRDRFDIGVEIQAVPWVDMSDKESREPTAAVRSRVDAARRRQLERQGLLNSQLDGRGLRGYVTLDRTSHRLMGTAVTRLGLSVRGVTRVLRVARTIADLSGQAKVQSDHVAEALQFRVPERSAALSHEA